MQNQQSILYYAGIILWEKAEHWRSTIVTSHLGEFDAHKLCSAKFRGSLITNFMHFQPFVKLFHWKLTPEPRISCKSIDEQHSRAMLPNLQGMFSKNIATHVAHPLFSCWYISTLHVMSCSCLLWCHSHLVWLVFEGSIPTCACCNNHVCSFRRRLRNEQ